MSYLYFFFIIPPFYSKLSDGVFINLWIKNFLKSYGSKIFVCAMHSYESSCVKLHFYMFLSQNNAIEKFNCIDSLMDEPEVYCKIKQKI